MSEDPIVVGDLFGLKPYGEAIKFMAEGIGNFLGRICTPIANEMGLVLRDKVREYRIRNLASVVNGAEIFVDSVEQGVDLKAPPRLVMAIIDKASWEEDKDVQHMWSGLLASSCSIDGNDDSNLIFINLLSNITRIQARIINYGCQVANKKLSGSGLILVDEPITVTFKDLFEIAGTDDIQRLDREMDYLRSIELLNIMESGLSPDDMSATIVPTSLALHLYARCQGYAGSPIEFYGLKQEYNE